MNYKKFGTIRVGVKYNIHKDWIFNGWFGKFLQRFCGYNEFKESLITDPNVELKIWVDTVEIFNLTFTKRVHILKNFYD